MFDSTPHKTPAPEDRNEIMTEAMNARLNQLRQSRGVPLLYSPPAIPPTAPTLDLIAIWSSDIAALRDSIDLVSNWGPYELIECAPADPQANDDRVLCRFYYHGAQQVAGPDTQGQFEEALRCSLDQITKWEPAA
jgi:hypothetical protein